MPPLPSPRCARCDLPLGTRHREGPGCLDCAEWPPLLREARCATALAPPAADLLHALKYEGWPAVVPLLARRMAARLPPRCTGVVVPVPTTTRRLRRRGYNQAALLAREVARLRNLDCLEVLVRRHAIDSQIALPVAQRRANVEGAFLPGEAAGRLPPSTHVILVDDVITTGATVVAGTRALEGLGVVSVTALAFARALPRALDAATASPMNTR
jgi:ComF family protein